MSVLLGVALSSNVTVFVKLILYILKRIGSRGLAIGGFIAQPALSNAGFIGVF